VIQQHSLTIAKTAHFYTIGEAGAQIENWWIVCHGYGQLAQHFIRRFDILDDAKTFILAPEGHSRFYVEGFGGGVGASWMTKEDRLDEIADYCHLLQTLYEKFAPQFSPAVRITVLGFSQGVPTVCRWVGRYKPAIHRLILFAGTLPDDVDFLSEKAYFADRDIFLVYGSEDPFLTPEKLTWQQKFIEKQELDIKVLTYEGGHEVQREVIHSLR
jgi:predicted esterase